MLEYRCNKSTAIVYKVRIGSSEWATITLQEWDRGGSCSIFSSYGNFNYIWISIGKGCLREFLIDLNYDYFMGKAHPSRGSIFDGEASCKQIKKDIIECRKDREIDKSRARQLWNSLEELDSSFDSADNFFTFLMYETVVGKEVYGDDYSSIPNLTMRDPQCNGFWEEIWPCACDVWKKELAE